jgi:hypothetical protein
MIAITTNSSISVKARLGRALDLANLSSSGVESGMRARLQPLFGLTLAEWICVPALSRSSDRYPAVLRRSCAGTLWVGLDIERGYHTTVVCTGVGHKVPAQHGAFLKGKR